jgi:aspartate ammonia-lyase
MSTQKKYGDPIVVVYNSIDHNGIVVTSNLVTLSSIVDGFEKVEVVEHVTAVYLDSTKAELNLTGSQVDTAIVKAISIPPWQPGQAVGFKNVAESAELKGAHAYIHSLQEEFDNYKKAHPAE